MRKFVSSRGTSLLAAAALLGVGGLLGAAASTDPEPTLVGISTYGEDQRRLIRMWSDGRCETNYLPPLAPGSLAHEWQPLDVRGQANRGR